VSCAGGAYSNEDNQDYDNDDGEDEDSDDDNSDGKNNSESDYAPVMTRSLMTMTANVICIVIPNSLIVRYWKMKYPLNPIV
jgi:hypothetical protein